jgi:hypothetical protein
LWRSRAGGRDAARDFRLADRVGDGGRHVKRIALTAGDNLVMDCGNHGPVDPPVKRSRSVDNPHVDWRRMQHVDEHLRHDRDQVPTPSAIYVHAVDLENGTLDVNG